MATSFTESYHDAAFILWEDDFHYSRDNVVIKSGAGILKPGTVLSKITQTAAAGTVTAKAGMTGNGTCVKDGTAPVQTGAQVGTYKIIMTDPTHFTVTNPGGETVGTGTSGVAFSDEIKFVLTAGSTPFVAGDEFDFPGPVTAVHATTDTPRAIVHNLQTGNYEAYRIFISCVQ